MTTFGLWILLAFATFCLGAWLVKRVERERVKRTWEVASGGGSEFKTLEEMTPTELEAERLQRWSILKSDTAWWVCRNEVPFMHCPGGLQMAKDILTAYKLACMDIDTRQAPTPAETWRQFRRERDLTGAERN